jgi:hypothetical protein
VSNYLVATAIFEEKKPDCYQESTKLLYKLLKECESALKQEKKQKKTDVVKEQSQS